MPEFIRQRLLLRLQPIQGLGHSLLHRVGRFLALAFAALVVIDSNRLVFSANSTDALNLAMSEAAVPLFEAVKTFIATEIDPMTEEFYRRQRELMAGVLAQQVPDGRELDRQGAAPPSERGNSSPEFTSAVVLPEPAPAMTARSVPRSDTARVRASDDAAALGPQDLVISTLKATALASLVTGLLSFVCFGILTGPLAVIFGLLNVINFTHGAQYMMGAFCAWFLLEKWGVGYWWSLLLAPLIGPTTISWRRPNISAGTPE